jgi:hypothetical protein
MKERQRRPAALKKARTENPVTKRVGGIAMNASQGDFMFVHQRWLPCPDAEAILAREPSIKVHTDMTLEMLIGPTGQGSTEAWERHHVGNS